MVEPLSVNTDGVRSLGDIHAGVATGLGSLIAGTPGAAEVAMSHGSIAYGVNTALTAALGSRSGSINVTQSSAETMSELLHQAALAYERGDERGGAAIDAAADAIARGETPVTGSTAAGAATSAGSASGTDAVGQIGSQLGQLGQQVGAPLAAIAQPLQQLPQQMVQGVQQMAGGGAQPPSNPGSDVAPQPDDRSLEEATPPASPPSEPVGATSGAQPGSGAAPVEPGDQQGPGPSTVSSRP